MKVLYVLFFSWATLACAQTAGELSGDYNEAYYELERLNAGLAPLEERINLQTPQAALEHFVLNAREGDVLKAAHALNLNLIPEAEQAERAPALARQLMSLIERERLINWDDLPDRPDAQLRAVPGVNNPLAGQPRRSLLLGELELNGRDIALRLQRVRVGEGAPVWVFSPNTTENIRPLYDQYGPGPVERTLPGWASARPFLGVPLWEWAALVALVLLCALIGWLAGRLSERAARSSRWPVRAYAGRLVRPVAFVVSFGLLFALTSGGLFFDSSVLGLLRPLAWVLFIGSLTWAGVHIISLFTRRFERRNENVLKEGYDDRAQRHLTVLSVTRRVFIFLVLLIGFGVGVSQFTSLELLGTTLLTSAGIASLIIGIAAQPVLSNIVAGLQVAITQPVRIGDSVFVENNWGYVEDLRYTYATVRTWDERRVVLPLRYLVTEPYENWTLRDTHIIKPIYLYTDYRVDVQKIREKFSELLKKSDDWDERQAPSVQVTSVSQEAVEIRALCSAKDPAAAWSLHCKLREDLIAYVQELEGGSYLPVQRLVLDEGAFRARTEQKKADAKPA